LTSEQDVLEAFSILDADRAGLIPGCLPTLSQLFCTVYELKIFQAKMLWSP
jgi:hypothetical protein